MTKEKHLRVFDTVSRSSSSRSGEVVEFDLRQFKTSTADWEAAVEAAVAKRALHSERAELFLPLSSGSRGTAPRSMVSKHWRS